MRSILWCLVLAVSIIARPAQADNACPAGDAPFPAMYRDPAPFQEAIVSADKHEPANEKLSGIIVPHHLVADDLIALGFRAASGSRYQRIVLLSPDHFRKSEKPFATTDRDFDTPLGRLSADKAATAKLLAHTGLVEDSCLFAAEHGVHALLPFLRHYFPDTPIVPVAISIASSRADWNRIAAALKEVVDEDTLVVQSTDFSHYLPQHEARAFDQQTLNLLAAGSLDGLAGLRQPEHLDSAGALYIQNSIQRDLFDARPLVAANENMQEYVKTFIAETTSYMVVLYGRFESSFNNPAYRASHIYYLAGDTMFGRAMTTLLLQEGPAGRIEAEIMARTKGRPMIVNLEGVVLPDVPEGIGHMTLAMPQQLTVEWLKKLNVVGAGLANNHAMDLGPAGYDDTAAALSEAGIPPFGQGEALTLPGLEIVGLSDIGTNASGKVDLITPELLDRLVREGPATPVIAFLHWGDEYAAEPLARQLQLADEMRLRSVTGIVGAHPHVAGDGIAALGGGDVFQAYSLGNFLFDQTAERSSGALIELRIFPQGTVYARFIPTPNFFDLR